jgi:mRNA interferase MazF
MHKGDIILVPFPFTDLSGQKIRPALVLYTASKGEDCIVAFISSVSKGKSVFDVSIKLSKTNGLKADSIIKLDKLATLEKKISLGEIGVLEPALMKMVGQKLRVLFAL